MKLWYQSLARETDSSDYHPRLKKVIDTCVDAGTEVDVHFITESAGIGVMYHYLRYRDMKECIDNALRAEQQGYDAFLIGNFSDSGLAEAREMVNIPVLGICETSMHIACMMGASFGMVPVSAKQTPDKIEKVKRYGFETRFVGALHMKSSPAGLKQAMITENLRGQVMADFSTAAHQLLERGAEVIIPAGGEFNIFLAEDGIFEIERAPVLNGIMELVKMGEFAVKMRKLTGRYTSKRFYYAPPSGDFLKRVRESYGADIYPGAK